jgi:tetratricopeptide (TPR) repeat protein
MLMVTMTEQGVRSPGGPIAASGDPLTRLRTELRRLHRHAGDPSTREVSRRVDRAISHTTVGVVLRCERVPRWGQLELVVEALGGDVEAYRRMWIAARDAVDGVDGAAAVGEDAPTGPASIGPVGATPVAGAGAPPAREDLSVPPPPVPPGPAGPGAPAPLGPGAPAPLGPSAPEPRSSADHADALRTAAAGWLQLAALLRTGQHAGAEASYALLVEAFGRALGEAHPATLEARYCLAWAREQRADWDGAQAELERILDARRRTLGDEHPDTVTTWYDLAWVREQRGGCAEAMADYRELLAILRRVLGDDHAVTVAVRYKLAEALEQLDDWTGVRAVLREILATRRRVLGDDHPATLETRGSLVWAQSRLGDRSGASAELRAVLDVQRRVLGDAHADTVSARISLDQLAEAPPPPDGVVWAEPRADAQPDDSPTAPLPPPGVVSGTAGQRPFLGVDYGAADTTAVLRWPDGRTQVVQFDGKPVLPSAVYLHPEHGLIVGREAVRCSRIEPTRFEPSPQHCVNDRVMMLGTDEVEVETLIAATLARVTADATAPGGGFGGVALTHPAEWGQPRRSVLARAAAAAGLGDVTLVPRPVAAARYFTDVAGHEVVAGRYIVMYDISADRFDTTLLCRTEPGTEPGFAVVASDGLAAFDELDSVVVNLIAASLGLGRDAGRRHGSGTTAQARLEEAWRRITNPTTPQDRLSLNNLWEDARVARDALARRSAAAVYVSGLDTEVYLSREDFDSAASAPLNRTAHLTMQMIRTAGREVGDLAGMFLLGAAARIPLAATILHRVIGVPPTVADAGDTIAAEGAACVLASARAQPVP